MTHIGEAPPDSFDPSALRLLAPDAPPEAADPQQWLFLDTETTGLAGGSGTYAFLVGIAWWDAGGLQVEQFFMRDHGEEHSLLVALAERLAERRVLVTFNGKSFDWPLLETRYRMTRSVRPPAARAHLDFLHPARNLWRLRLGSVRLIELERSVLGWNRGPDIMGELMPQIYFDFLRGGPPDALVPVFHHNQMDLRGLAGLACRVLAILGNPEAHGKDPLELYGVSRICERRGESRRARSLYERSIASELPTETDRAAKLRLARLAKRDGDISAACALWEALLGNSRSAVEAVPSEADTFLADGPEAHALKPAALEASSLEVPSLEAYEQLMIHHEHTTRDLDRAADLARKALAELRKASQLGTIAPHACRRGRERFEQRLARLERKASKSSPLLSALQKSPPKNPRISRAKLSPKAP